MKIPSFRIVWEATGFQTLRFLLVDLCSGCRLTPLVHGFEARDAAARHFPRDID